jgi:tight adherence protein B
MTAASAALLAALCAAGAIFLARPLPAVPPEPRRGPRAGPGIRTSVVLLGAGAAVATGWSLLSPRMLVLALVAAATGAGAARMVRRRRAAHRADRRAELVLATCEALAADLASGQPPLRALRRSAEDWPELDRAASAGDMGADVPTALRELAALPGAGQLRTLAASWEVAHQTGSGLADAVGRAADTIRSERRTARLVTAELASARATARMLAVLPVGVLLMGVGVGGDPVGFLLGTTVGLGCLVLGLLLCWAGLTWLDRIADRVLGR